MVYVLIWAALMVSFSIYFGASHIADAIKEAGKDE